MKKCASWKLEEGGNHIHTPVQNINFFKIYGIYGGGEREREKAEFVHRTFMQEVPGRVPCTPYKRAEWNSNRTHTLQNEHRLGCKATLSRTRKQTPLWLKRETVPVSNFSASGYHCPHPVARRTQHVGDRSRESDSAAANPEKSSQHSKRERCHCIDWVLTQIQHHSCFFRWQVINPCLGFSELE